MIFVSVVLWTLSGMLTLPPTWSTSTCEDVYDFYEGLRKEHGGELEFSCATFPLPPDYDYSPFPLIPQPSQYEDPEL